MITRSVDIKTADGICDAYVAYPDESGRYSAVILFMDAWGLRLQLEKMAQRLSATGYYVVVPNVFYRIKKAPVFDVKFPMTPESRAEALKVAMPVIQGYDGSKLKTDVAAFVDFLLHQKQVQRGGFGATGYCMGGGLALRAAAYFPERFSAVASFHAGRLVSDSPESVHCLLQAIKAEIYVAHADHDPSMPAEQIAVFGEALKKSHPGAKAEVYEGAAHGWTMADMPVYNKAADEKHWGNLLSFFDRVLKS